MVYFTEEDVYSILTFEWQSGRKIRLELRNRLGIENQIW
jgi:hypothetical protein